MKGPAWTQREVYQLMGYAETVSQETAARRLGRSLMAVQSKIRALGIRWRQGKTVLMSLARELGCSETTVAKMAQTLFWSEKTYVGWGNGRRYYLSEEQVARLRAVLTRNLVRHAAHRVAGRRK